MILWGVVLMVVVGCGEYYPVPSQLSDSLRTSQATANRPLGDCECDLMANQCDSGCCCDPVCPTAYRTSLELSKPFECYQYSSYQCYARTYLIYVNPKIGMNIIDQLSTPDRLCIETDSKDTKIHAYLQEYGISSQQAKQIAITNQEQKAYYSKQSVTDLPTAKLINPSSSGSLSLDLIMSSSNGQCIRLPNGVSLLPDRPAQQCIQTMTISAETCKSGSVLDINSYLQSMTSHSIELAYTYQINSDGTTKQINKIAPQFSTSQQSCGCAHAIRILNYYIVMKEGSVHKILVEAYLQSISMTNCGQYSFGLEVSYSFVNQYYGPIGQGGPGYMVGSALRIGTKQNDYVYSTLAKASLPFQKQDNTCIMGQYILMDPTLQQPLLFGQNSLLSCSLTMDEQQLQQFCTSSSLDSISIFSLPTQIGRISTSNINYMSDWITVQQDLSRSVSYDKTSKTCSMPLQLNLQINYRKEGLVDQPQMVVHSAYQFFSANERVQYQAGVSSLIRFHLNISYYDQDAYKQYQPKQAKLFPQLPEDIFSPLLNGGSLGWMCIWVVVVYTVLA